MVIVRALVVSSGMVIVRALVVSSGMVIVRALVVSNVTVMHLVLVVSSGMVIVRALVVSNVTVMRLVLEVSSGMGTIQVQTRVREDLVRAGLVPAGQDLLGLAQVEPDRVVRARVVHDQVARDQVEAVADNLIHPFDTLLADLDGVVYEGTLAIHGAVEAINKAQSMGKTVGYVTNNSSRKPETIADQLNAFGLHVQPGDIISSGQTGVELLATLIPAGAKVLVVGGEGLRKRVVDAGFALVESSDDHPAGVIQGFAPDVAWRNLAEAAFSIQNGAKWVATNSDWTLPQEKGLAPGNGTLVSAVHTAVGILPQVAGKPEPAIFHTAVSVLESKAPLFIGDRIDTDIVGANRAGIPSALVLTGVSTRKELLGIAPEGRPTFILGNLSELHRPYQAPKATKYGFSCEGSKVELLTNRVRVVDGDPKSLGALKAACAVIWSSPTPIYGLDVDPALYE
jgi:HAD superfamily hydrolase (TIGR01450 family)